MVHNQLRNKGRLYSRQRQIVQEREIVRNRLKYSTEFTERAHREREKEGEGGIEREVERKGGESYFK